MGKKELFGERAIKLGFVSEKDVELALETQQMLTGRSNLLGDIMLDLEFIDHEQYVKIVAAVDKKLAGKKRASEDIPEIFCAKALDLGFVTEDQVRMARKIQQNWQRRVKLVGQIMLDLGSLTEKQLQKILDSYSK